MNGKKIMMKVEVIIYHLAGLLLCKVGWVIGKIKKGEMKVKEKRWKPEEGKKFWCFDAIGCVGEDVYCSSYDGEKLEFGNCFKTEEEAEYAAARVNALLLSLQPTCNQLATNLQDKKLPEWCKVGEWVYTCNGDYRKVEAITDGIVCLSGGLNVPVGDIHSEMVSARLRPYNKEEMRGLVGKVVCGSEGKTFLVLAYSPNTVFFGGFSHTPEDLTLDIYKLPDGSPCAILEHLEDGEWVR